MNEQQNYQFTLNFIKMKTLKLQRVTRYFGYILLAVVTFTPLQWCWNKFASMCKINLWAMKNTNGKMCLWRFNLGEPTWEKVL